MLKREAVDIIIPTYDNYSQLSDCVQSMAMTRNDYPMNIIIVNNGTAKIQLKTESSDKCGITVVESNDNLGWIGGLREGLKYSNSKYVLFANDDIFIPRSSDKWLFEMVRTLEVYPEVGAVGPSSNLVMGTQNIWRHLPASMYDVTFLIGFCMLVRREALDKAGGVQDMEFGGDDIDLSIRLRKAGYSLITRRDLFVYHHGFQTGNKVHGDHTKEGGWNSRTMTDNVNMEIIRKHGFLEWWNTMINMPKGTAVDDDVEKQIVASFVNGDKLILELGCGSKKSVPHAIGVDIVPNGEMSPYINEISVADVVANIEKEIPFDNKSIDCIIARHVLEHVSDPVEALALWGSKLKDGGKLIISCPDERFLKSIPMNPEHKHAYTPESLLNLTNLLGFKGKGIAEGYNYISFTLCLEKV
jgi:predicted SAM-dependent methyltransferase